MAIYISSPGGHCFPLLFIIFISDLVDCVINSKGLNFADDFKFWRAVESISDQELLQEDLDRLAGWCAANKLQLNIDRCCFISFFRKASRFQTIYSIDGRALKYISSDLGVVLDEKLSLV